MTAPTLILIGELDDWALAEECRNMVEGRDDWGISRQKDKGVPIKLIVFPGAYHAFDAPRLTTPTRADGTSSRIQPVGDRSIDRGVARFSRRDDRQRSSASDYQSRRVRCLWHALRHPVGGVVTEQAFPGYGEIITQVWRIKQLEYTWLRSLMRRYEDFSVVTRDSLAYTLRCLGLKYDEADFAAHHGQIPASRSLSRCACLARGDEGQASSPFSPTAALTCWTRW